MGTLFSPGGLRPLDSLRTYLKVIGTQLNDLGIKERLESPQWAGELETKTPGEAH